MAAKRSYGSGSIYLRTDSGGREVFYGSWYSGTRRMNRRLGPKRRAGSREGLTTRQAEQKLQELMLEAKPSLAAGERLRMQDAASLYLASARRKGRKPSTCANIESEVRVHLAPFFAGKSLDTIERRDVLDLMSALEANGLAPKTIKNIINTLSAIFNFARAAEPPWATANPCEGIERPVSLTASEPRFLTLEELDALIAHLPAGTFAEGDRVLFLAAALTGLRKGELVALRGCDVDWQAQRIRVRRNYTRGAFGTPKSRRSTRAVPMADELAGALDRLYQRSRWQADTDLVFAHPVTGGVQAKSNISRRMHSALTTAGLEEHRFHDLRHTFGTRAAAAGVPMRTLQEWMGHVDIQTTMIYADYSPGGQEAEMIGMAFRRPNPLSAQPGFIQVPNVQNPTSPEST